MKILATTSGIKGPVWTGEVFSIALADGSVAQVKGLSGDKVCGMDIYANDIYCASYVKGSILVYDGDYNLKWQKVVGSNGLHTIRVVNKKIFVVDSHAGKIIVLDLSGNEQEIIVVSLPSRYSGIKGRTHVNAAALCAESLYYIVRFMYEDVDDGFVMTKEHVPIIQGLDMPHSLLIRNGHIYLCNSWKFTLEKYSLLGELLSSIDLKDYTRGLCWVKEDL